MNREKPWVTGAALAETAAVFYIACGLAALLFPDADASIFSVWTQAVDAHTVQSAAQSSMGFSDWVVGFVGVIAAVFVAGALYSWLAAVSLGSKAKLTSRPRDHGTPTLSRQRLSS
ncbi:MAG: DUF5676 family membrane protein [Burkholderiales bacterium]